MFLSYKQCKQKNIYPANPPDSMWFAKVTSSDQTWVKKKTWTLCEWSSYDWVLTRKSKIYPKKNLINVHKSHQFYQIMSISIIKKLIYFPVNFGTEYLTSNCHFRRPNTPHRTFPATFKSKENQMSSIKIMSNLYYQYEYRFSYQH